MATEKFNPQDAFLINKLEARDTGLGDPFNPAFPNCP